MLKYKFVLTRPNETKKMLLFFYRNQMLNFEKAIGFAGLLMSMFIFVSVFSSSKMIFLHDSAMRRWTQELIFGRKIRQKPTF